MNTAQNSTSFQRLVASIVSLALAGAISAKAADPDLSAVEYERQMDVVYGYKDGMGLIMDVLTPKQHRNGAGVLVIASGGLISSPTNLRGANWQERRPALAGLLGRGYVLFVVKHGSAPKYSLAEIRSDIPRAVRFIRHHASRFGIDADRIGVTGGSSGGLLALLLATGAPIPEPDKPDEVDRESPRVRAVVAYFPVTDFMTWESGTIQQEVGGEREKATEAELSPITHVSKDTPPTLLLHGDQDESVPIQQSRIFLNRMQDAGAECKLIEMPGMSHAWRAAVEGEVAAVAGWFDRWLLRERKQ